MVAVRGGKTVEKDRSEMYNTGAETLAAGAIVLVIGVMFQILGADITSRTPATTDMSSVMQHIAWVFWVAPFCYLVSAVVLGVGVYLLRRAYRRTHPRDRQQVKLTSYRE